MKCHPAAILAFIGLISLSVADLTHARAATLEDLRKLDIICYVPAYLPAGFRLKSVDTSVDDPGPTEHFDHPLPLYGLEYGDDHGRTFSIDSAREGIGDRNIMGIDDTEDAEFRSPQFGTVYVIFTPKGKGGPKVEIKSNWVEDANMQAEKAQNAGAHPDKGRFHGFSGGGITLDEFTKVVNSLHPIRTEGVSRPAKSERGGALPTDLKIHPKVFNLIGCWLSDSESPVVTEINLDAVEKNGNEFNDDGLRQDGEWWRCPMPESNGGFMRYRVLERHGDKYKVEYQENGGGSLTTSSTIEFTIEQRRVERDGRPLNMRVLRVLSLREKQG